MSEDFKAAAERIFAAVACAAIVALFVSAAGIALDVFQLEWMSR